MMYLVASSSQASRLSTGNALASTSRRGRSAAGAASARVMAVKQQENKVIVTIVVCLDRMTTEGRHLDVGCVSCGPLDAAASPFSASTAPFESGGAQVPPKAQLRLPISLIFADLLALKLMTSMV